MSEEHMTRIGEVISASTPQAASLGGVAQAAEMVRPFSHIGREDVALVGGKGANLGEMTGVGLPVPPGFVVTVDAYARFLAHNQLAEKIRELLETLDVDDTSALQRAAA